MTSIFRAKVLSLDGTPDKNGELFAPWSIKNYGKVIPVKNGAAELVGTAIVARAGKDEEGVFAEFSIQDSRLFGCKVNVQVGASVYDCDHRFEKGVSVAIRANDADVFEVLLDGEPHPDARIGQILVPKPSHDGAGTDPEE